MKASNAMSSSLVSIWISATVSSTAWSVTLIKLISHIKQTVLLLLQVVDIIIIIIIISDIIAIDST